MSMLTPSEDVADHNLKRSATENSYETSPDPKRLRPTIDAAPDTGNALSETQRADGAERLRQKELKDAEKKAEKERKEAERKVEKERKEMERKAEKERKEAERLAEKEKKEAERKAEKERKEAERLAEKERKEAEKQAEKERKEAEKQAEKERKEAEKQAEKERKQKEQLKAQPKINLFFKKSSPAPAVSSQPLSQGQLTINTIPSSPDPAMSEEALLSDYHKHILPFHVKANAQLFSGTCNYSPSSHTEHTAEPAEWLRSMALVQPAKPESTITSHQFRTGLLLAQESAQVADLLAKLRVRRLQFSHLSARYAEDPSVPVNEEFRPPYVGSTKDIDRLCQLELAVDPFRTDLDSSVAYDYDSEAEWDHEDGEDLRDDDGDDSDEDIEDQDELKEFLSSDDDSPVSPKKSKLVGPLTPIVIWSDGTNAADLKQFSIEILCIPPEQDANINALVLKKEENTASAGAPDTVASVLEPLVNKVGFEPLKESMASHNGSTGTKTLIVELLKLRFPEATSNEIRAAFDICMERVGKKRSEKKWVLTGDASKYFLLPLEESATPNLASDLSEREDLSATANKLLGNRSIPFNPIA